MLNAAAGAPAEKPRRVFVLEHYFLKNGSQGGRIHEYFGKALLAALKRAGCGPSLFLDALVAAHMPQVAAIHSFDSLGHMMDVRRKLAADKELAPAFGEWENHAEAPYEDCSFTLLEATPYCPLLAAADGPRKTPRIFELRVYHSPTWRQLRALHERFAGPEIRIFHRVGVHPVLYSSTVIGPHMPNLTYVIPFESLDAREKAWAAFGADPEWVKVRRESIARSGQISSVIQISLYRATGYSPVQ